MDAFSEPVFWKVMDKYVDEGSANVILDLAQIDFVDSSGLGALVRLAKKIQTIGGTLQIISNPRVTQTVRLVRLEQFLSLRGSLDEALSNLPGGV